MYLVVNFRTPNLSAEIFFETGFELTSDVGSKVD